MRRRILGGNRGGSSASTIYADIIGVTDPTIRAEIDYFFNGIYEAGIDERLFAIYPFIGNSYNQFKYNMLDPRDLNDAYRLNIPTGTPVYNTNSVIGGSFLTYINPVNFEPYSYHLGYFSLTQNTTASTLLYNNNSGSGAVRLIASGNNIINDGYDTVGAAERLTTNIGASTGFMVAERISSVAQRNYHQGIKKGEDTQTPSGLTATSTSIFITPQNLVCGFVTLGNFLNEAQNAELYRLINRMNIVLAR